MTTLFVVNNNPPRPRLGETVTLTVNGQKKTGTVDALDDKGGGVVKVGTERFIVPAGKFVRNQQPTTNAGKPITTNVPTATPAANGNGQPMDEEPLELPTINYAEEFKLPDRQQQDGADTTDADAEEIDFPGGTPAGNTGATQAPPGGGFRPAYADNQPGQDTGLVDNEGDDSTPLPTGIAGRY